MFATASPVSWGAVSMYQHSRNLFVRYTSQGSPDRVKTDGTNVYMFIYMYMHACMYIAVINFAYVVWSKQSSKYRI